MGDLRTIYSIVMHTHSQGLMGLVRSALNRSRPAPTSFCVSVPVLVLLHSIELMPKRSITERRNRLLSFCAVILAARLIDLTSLARNEEVLHISESRVLLRFVSDKGSLLLGRS